VNNISASILAKLKNKSKKQNIPLQQLLNLFCQEKFIRRLSKSNYRFYITTLRINHER
jgi:mannitol/fructose-specific phosphotransferase system IIA component (Ntr-type)